MITNGAWVGELLSWDPYPPSDYGKYKVGLATVSVPTDAVFFTTGPGMVDREKIVVVPTATTVFLRSMTIDTPVSGGMNATGTVSMSNVAPEGGLTVVLSGTRSGLASVPSSVTITAGESSATFTVTTQATAVKRGALIKATYGAQLRTAVLSILPPPSVRTPVTESTPLSLRPVNQRSADAPQSFAPILSRSTVRGPATETEPPLLNRYSFYTPELNLLAETERVSTGTPAIQYEYLWFAGQPIAQITTATNEIAWYFDDHLGTPVLQTDATAAVVWRVEREPYGKIYAHRAGPNRHQPLAFPGQEDQDGEVSYNVFRWYRSGWGRYTQADQMILASVGTHLYAYAAGDPVNDSDPLGLWNKAQCEAAHELLRREEREGTKMAAVRSNNTVSGDGLLTPFNNDLGNQPNFPMADGKEIDIDWFTDLSSVSADDPEHRQNLPAIYLYFKSAWYIANLGQKGFMLPFQDPGERTALALAVAGARYSDILVDEVFERECGCARE